MRKHSDNSKAVAAFMNKKTEIDAMLGSDEALDYRLDAAIGPFDVILDVPGVLPNALARLAPGGRLGLVTASPG